MSGVSVIVPARDAADTLPRTLSALAAQDLGEPFEVIVVDDGSTDGTARIAEASPVVTSAVRGPQRGPGSARDAGVRAATGALLAFTDADCFPAPGWLRAGAGALGDADLVQGRVDPDPAARLGPFDRTLHVHGPYGLFETANVFMRRSLFDSVGGFGTGIPDAEKGLAEDVFLGWRARRSGARTAFCEEALVHHAVFPRSAAEFVDERRRLRHFPRIAREVPELRDSFFRHRWFLNARTEMFDAAVAGVALAAARRSLLPLALAVPYAVATRRLVRHWPQEDPVRVAGAFVAADAVGAAALLRGSVSARSLLL